MENEGLGLEEELNETLEDNEIECLLDEDGNIRIKKFSQYIAYVEKLPEEFNLSRGQASIRPLLPSVLRKDDRDKRKFSRFTASNLLNQFKLNSHFYMDKPWDVKNDYEWMIHAQHYGLPTRLLDFSKSHIIALMFAVEKAFEEEESGVKKDGEVWFLNSNKLNDIHCRRREILNLTEDNLALDSHNGPVVVQGRKSNIRVNAQNGLFIYFQDSEKDLLESIKDNLPNDLEVEDIIRKVIIDKDSKKEILVALFSMGFGFTQIYPELFSVSKDILLTEKTNEYKKSLRD